MPGAVDAQKHAHNLRMATQMRQAQRRQFRTEQATALAQRSRRNRVRYQAEQDRSTRVGFHFARIGGLLFLIAITLFLAFLCWQAFHPFLLFLLAVSAAGVWSSISAYRRACADRRRVARQAAGEDPSIDDEVSQRRRDRQMSRDEPVDHRPGAAARRNYQRQRADERRGVLVVTGFFKTGWLFLLIAAVAYAVETGHWGAVAFVGIIGLLAGILLRASHPDPLSRSRRRGGAGSEQQSA